MSPTQVNAQIPAGTSLGTASLTALQSGTSVAQGTVAIDVAPRSFTATANGTGIAAVVQRVKGNGQQSYEPIAQYDAAQPKVVALLPSWQTR